MTEDDFKSFMKDFESTPGKNIDLYRDARLPGAFVMVSSLNNWALDDLDESIFEAFNEAVRVRRRDIVPRFRKVPEEEYFAFLDDYPRKLTPDISGIAKPALVSYSDFQAAEGITAMVAKYTDAPVGEFKYYISDHLL